ncbi:MAG TPA: tetratricopeptide repeat protein, partial [Candidatus Dormibacteraeota bacterium]|nr:tetratricopeptide repeat protein [Candidatus Dormibacteraeota bacterium]
MKDNTPIGVFGMFLAAVVLALVCQFHASACLWDADTLADEQNQHPTLAGAILNPTTDEPVDAKSLTERIQQLRAEPHETDAGWWNNLAGAYVRLGQPGEAVKILEPLTNTFSNDYGIHANLGTAYHLLKRYSDAEREIARDLEINPDAHFGLEKYHLALLHYLIRDEHYRLRHVFVDEFTYSFLTGSGFRATDSHLRDVETNIYVVPENPRPSPDEERLETELKGQP